MSLQPSKKLLSFLWKKKKDKIRRTGLYEDYGTGGLRMTDFEIMTKALRLAWISRLLCTGDQNYSLLRAILRTRIFS